ncbi:MAG TPA: lysophospholipase [bacterium]|nr:lysophospholipase [bacterium]
MEKVEYFRNSKSERFRYRENIPENSKAAVLCVHGFAEHFGRYSHIEEKLVGSGYSFHMMDNRGHGKSVGKRGHIGRYDDYIDDLHLFRKMVQEKNGNKKLFVLGHSNGSLISARYALKYGDGISGLVLSGIPIRQGFEVNPLKLKLGLALAKVVPGLTVPGEIPPEDICRDKKVVQDYINDPLVFKVNSVGFAREFFWAMEDLLSRAAEFKHPVLFLHGGSDKLCSPPAAKEFYEKISSDDKEFILYDGLYHEVFNEFEKEDIIAGAIQWLNKRAGE